MTIEQVTQEAAVEKAKRRQIDVIFWGGAFIGAGLVFLAENLDILLRIGTTDEWGFWIFLVAGAWALLINIFLLVAADWPNPNTWDFIWTAILLFIGLGGAFDFDVQGTTVAAVVLVGIGVLILASVLLRREQAGSSRPT